MAIELPQGYYLENFQKLIGFVYEQYPDLLTDAEKAFYLDFQTLSLPEQRLYVRLISRKGPYFRSDKLQYSEIPDIIQALQALSEADFVEINPPIELELLLDLLLRDELLQLSNKASTGLNSLKKPELLQHFLEEGEEETLLRQISQWFSWVEPIRLKELLIYRLCFFGNLRQDLTEFVLLDLGMIRYENYQIHQEDRYFQNRVLLDSTLEMLLLGELSESILAQGDVETILDYARMLPHHHQDPTLQRRHNRLINTLARQLERLDAFEEALTLYEQSDYPPARERRARILVKQNKPEAALALCEEMLETPLNEEETEFAEKFGNRLKKKLGQSIPVPARMAILEEDLLLSFLPDQPVEMQVALHLASEGCQVFYVENHLWRGLFGLAFWDILFMPVRGAFFNLYQRGPKGLFSPAFRLQRQEAIEERLSLIQEDENWPERILSTFHKKHGISNHLVSWPLLSEHLIQLSLERIPRQHFVHIFDRLSYDLSNNRTGFPDLIAFPSALETHANSMKKGYQLIEIKGPGDRLQQNQRRWIKYFDEYEIPYRVIHVKYE